MPDIPSVTCLAVEFEDELKILEAVLHYSVYFV